MVVQHPHDDTVFRRATTLGAQGLVHLATGTLPAPSPLTLDDALAKAERGECRLAVVVSSSQLPNKLRYLLLVGPRVPKQALVASASTRTPGLVTAADVADEGREITFTPGGRTATRDLARRIEATEAAKVPVLALWGGFAGFALGLALLALRWPKLTKAARISLVFAAAGTVALLPAALATTVLGHISLFVAATLVLGAALGRHGVRPLLMVVVVLVVLDTVFRGGMVANATLSGFYGSGIRFYGIGNEYMGMVIGAALMSVPKRGLSGVGIGLTLLLGLPFLGANAGGAMAAVVAFFPPTQKRWWRLGLPFLVVAVLAVLDRLQPGAAQSHIGQAAGKGPSAWGEIILRKLAMNARLTVAGPTLAGIVAVGLGVWQLRTLLPRVNPELRARVAQGFWGAGGAIAFNDSGTVAALLLLAPVVVTVIEQALCDFSESTSAPNASALPSPMSSASEPTP